MLVGLQPIFHFGFDLRTSWFWVWTRTLHDTGDRVKDKYDLIIIDYVPDLNTQENVTLL